MQISTRFALWLVLALATTLVGCAAPARIDQMKVDTSLAIRTTVAASPLKTNLAIKDVTGGSETNPMGASKVSSQDFERALEASLRDAGLLSAGRAMGKYQLQAHMQRLEQPMFGASMTVTSKVQYTLIERSTGKEVAERTLAAPFTAAWSAAFAGTERLKLANEGAIRENIKQLIDWLVAQKVSGVEIPKP